MRRRSTYSIKTPTTAVEMLDMAKDMYYIMTSPLTDQYDQARLNRMNEVLDQLPDKYASVIHRFIDRKLEAYYMPNEDGFSAYDMDQAILRAS